MQTVGKRTVTKGTVGDGGISIRTDDARDMPPSSTALGMGWTVTHISRCGLQIYHRLRRFEKGVETNARARMTDDCQKGIAKFLNG